MKENKNIPSTHLSDRLPVHSPDERLWNSISSGLENLEAEQVYGARLQDLPVHSPDEASWGLLLRRMQRVRLVKIGGYSLLAVAASLLLLISIFRIPENNPGNPKGFANINTGKTNSANTQNTASQGNTIDNNITPSPNIQQKTGDNSIRNSSPVTYDPGKLIDKEIVRTDRVSNGSTLADNSPSRNLPAVNRLIPRTRLTSAIPKLSFRYSQPVPVQYAKAIITQPVVKYYSPEPYNPNKKKGNSFELAANYLPESLDNGYGTSMFHNFGLMASLGNEKTRVQSSVGMAYNTEHRSYDVDYTQLITITVPKPGQAADSSYSLAAEGNSKLEGTESHQYFTYDLGVGKKLFSLGKMTTWINTGAGFAVRLDQSSLKEQTIKTINSHNQAEVNSIDLEIPDYNKMNVNLMAGLDFNYLVMKRLVISFAPTSRFYLKSVLEKNGSSTDNFSLGFRSGVKFKF